MAEKPAEKPVEEQLTDLRRHLGAMLQTARYNTESLAADQHRLFSHAAELMNQLSKIMEQYHRLTDAKAHEQTMILAQVQMLIEQTLTLQTEAIKALRADIEGLRERVKTLEAQQGTGQGS